MNIINIVFESSPLLTPGSDMIHEVDAQYIGDICIAPSGESEYDIEITFKDEGFDIVIEYLPSMVLSSGSFAALVDVLKANAGLIKYADSEIRVQSDAFAGTIVSKKMAGNIRVVVKFDASATKVAVAGAEPVGSVAALTAAALLVAYRKVSEMDSYTLSYFDPMVLSDVDMVVIDG